MNNGLLFHIIEFKKFNITILVKKPTSGNGQNGKTFIHFGLNLKMQADLKAPICAKENPNCPFTCWDFLANFITNGN
jgi:hypothetical protein